MRVSGPCGDAVWDNNNVEADAAIADEDDGHAKAASKSVSASYDPPMKTLTLQNVRRPCRRHAFLRSRRPRRKRP